jgi:hypothetical protein
MDASDARLEALRREWTDLLVEVNAERPELARFKDIVGRVVTVNWNHKAIVDFQDGGWYDISASEDCLRKLDASAAAKYKNENSAQPIPEKQG